jgi:hypothetical protein
VDFVLKERERGNRGRGSSHVAIEERGCSGVGHWRVSQHAKWSEARGDRWAIGFEI